MGRTARTPRGGGSICRRRAATIPSPPGWPARDGRRRRRRRGTTRTGLPGRWRNPHRAPMAHASRCWCKPMAQARGGAMEPPAYTGRYRAGVIGHTGRGNYGHGLDLALVGLPGVEVVAVADADEAGRNRAAQRIGAARRYADYRQMLETERLDVVAIGPRQPDQREAMLLAAIRAGVQAIYSEKPFARSLAEADRVLDAADARGVKIAVAHQNRAFPGPRLARQLIDAGRIGRLRALKAYGKQDRRGGGQDLMVLGTHLLDLMRSFAG